MAFRKEARGSYLFSYLNGVQVVAGSNPAAPTIDRRNGLNFLGLLFYPWLNFLMCHYPYPFNNSPFLNDSKNWPPI